MERGKMWFWSAISWLICVGIAFVLTQVFDPHSIPPDKTAPSYGRGDQCERLRTDSTVMEPENTWSNLAYLFVGLLIFFRNLGTTRVFGTMYGASLILLAWFSGLYHSNPVNGTFQSLDVATIYWVLGILCTYALYGVSTYRNNTGTWGNTHIIFICLFWILFGTTIAFGADSTYLTMIFIGVLVAYTAVVLFKIKLFHPIADLDKIAYTSVLGLLLVGCAVFRLFDGTGDFLGIDKFGCNADSIFQFHAAWHICSALTLGIGYNLFSRAFDDEGTIIPDLNESKLVVY